jgi:hypothetical protein
VVGLAFALGARMRRRGATGSAAATIKRTPPAPAADRGSMPRPVPRASRSA